MNDIRRGIRWGAGVFGFFKALRLDRKARRQERRGERPADGAEEFQRDEDRTMLQGYKTYIGIATAVVGVVLSWTGLNEAESAALSAQIVDALDKVLTIAGLVFATYGRTQANKAA